MKFDRTVAADTRRKVDDVDIDGQGARPGGDARHSLEWNVEVQERRAPADHKDRRANFRNDASAFAEGDDSEPADTPSDLEAGEFLHSRAVIGGRGGEILATDFSGQHFHTLRRHP